MARPTIYNEPLIDVSIGLPAELREWLRQYAAQQRPQQSMQAIIRYVLEEWREMVESPQSPTQKER